MAESRFDFLVERHQFVVAEGKQKTAASRIVGRIVGKQAIVSNWQGLVEIPGLERLLDIITAHAVLEFADFPGLGGEGEQ